MFCNRCGAALQPGQTVCPNCAQVQTAEPVAQSRLVSQVKLLAILWFIIAAFTGIGATFMLGAGFAASSAMHMSADVPEPARMIGPMVVFSLGIFIAAMAGVSFLTGWGLLTMKRWARVLAIVIAVLSLPCIPFGTALGIYTLVVLMPASAGQEYERVAAA